MSQTTRSSLSSVRRPSHLSPRASSPASRFSLSTVKPCTYTRALTSPLSVSLPSRPRPAFPPPRCRTAPHIPPLPLPTDRPTRQCTPSPAGTSTTRRPTAARLTAASKRGSSSSRRRATRSTSSSASGSRRSARRRSCGTRRRARRCTMPVRRSHRPSASSGWPTPVGHAVGPPSARPAARRPPSSLLTLTTLVSVPHSRMARRTQRRQRP